MRPRDCGDCGGREDCRELPPCFPRLEEVDGVLKREWHDGSAGCWNIASAVFAACTLLHHHRRTVTTTLSDQDLKHEPRGKNT